MKFYQCHKKVFASKVKAADKEMPGAPWRLACEDGEIYEVRNARPEEHDLGYAVRYADGYTSWSPDKAFEDGYTEIRPS